MKNFRAFLFGFSALVAIRLAAATTAENPAVANLAAKLSDGRIVVSWDPCVGASSYKVDLWQVTYGAPGGMIDFEATFDDVANEGTGTKRLSAYPGYDDWAWNSVSIPKNTIGMVQVGSGENQGWLLTPELRNLTSGVYTLEIVVGCVEASPKCRVCHVTNGGATTNELGIVDGLPHNAFKTYVISPVEVAQNDQLLFVSENTAQECRVRIDSIRLVSGAYAAGQVVTNDWGMADIQAADIPDGVSPSATFTNADFKESNYGIRVTAHDEAGEKIASIENVRHAVFSSAEQPGPDDPEEEPSGAGLAARVVATTDGAFSLAWESGFAFTNCVLHAWTNREEGADKGAPLWVEGFTNATASTSNKFDDDDEFNKAIDDSSRTGYEFDWLYYAKEAGAIRIGKDGAYGWLKLPPIVVTDENAKLKIRAKRYGKDAGRLMPIDVVSETNPAETNHLEVQELALEYEDYWVKLPQLKETDRILLHSVTDDKDGRVVLDSVEIWTGVKEGVMSLETNLVRSVGTSGFAIVSDVPAATLTAQLEGLGETTNVLSDVFTIDLENPMTNAWWRASSFKNNARDEDFGWVTNVTKETDWRNGETIPGFHVYQNESDVAKIKFDSKKTTYSGLFASSTNKTGFAWSVSLRASEENDAVLELRVLNDKDKTIDAVTLCYDVYEWHHQNNALNASALANALAVAKHALMPPTVWRDVTDAQISDEVVVVKKDKDAFGYAKNRRTVRLPVTVALGEVFHYRWIAPKLSNAPMLGVGDLTVTLGWQLGFAVILR